MAFLSVALLLGCHHVLEDTAQGLITYYFELTIITHSIAITTVGHR